jgi:hypothetical protein
LEIILLILSRAISLGTLVSGGRGESVEPTLSAGHTGSTESLISHEERYFKPLTFSSELFDCVGQSRVFLKTKIATRST